MGWISASVCDAGLLRQSNQDRICCFQKKDCGLYMVADGMGGHYHGEQASGALQETFSGWWREFSAALWEPTWEENVGQLRALLDDCNAEIWRATPLGQVCGSTLVLLWLQGGRYALFHVGDSRCYQVSTHHGLLPRMTQLTHDDVYQGTDVRQVGRLTQAVGGAEECQVNLQTGSVPANALFALCSDGVYKFCAPERLERALVQALQRRRLEEAVQEIATLVEKNGAKDNYSLVLACR